jgi:hypothetical protein
MRNPSNSLINAAEPARECETAAVTDSAADVTAQQVPKGPPGLGKVFARAFLPIIPALALGWWGVYAAYSGTGSVSDQNWIWPSAALLWLIPVLLAGKGGRITAGGIGIFVIGIYLIAVSAVGGELVQSYALSSRGEVLPAKVDHISVSGTPCQCGPYQGENQFTFTTLDASHQTGQLQRFHRGLDYSEGDHVTVAIDPEHKVATMDEALVNPVRLTVIAAIPTALVLLLAFGTALGWRTRRRATPGGGAA